MKLWTQHGRLIKDGDSGHVCLNEDCPCGIPPGKQCWCVTNYYAAWCWGYWEDEETWIPGHWTINSPWYDPDSEGDGCLGDTGEDADWYYLWDVENEECGGPGMAGIFVYVSSGEECTSGDPDVCVEDDSGCGVAPAPPDLPDNPE